MADYTFDPSKDPAKRGKGSFLSGNNPGYPKQVADYNAWLYTPMDRRPTPNPQQSNIPDPSLLQYTAPGWHMPNATNPKAIENQYTPGGIPGFNAQPPATGLAGPSGALGASGSAASTQPSILDTAPKATFQGGPTPPQNALQRWSTPQQQGNGIKPLSDQRRYFWATGHIDARATPSPQQSSPGPVTFNNSPSKWVAW